MGTNSKFVDWFVFEDYSEIRLYGAGVEPYRLPVFVPMKKGHMFKFPMTVGPFIVNMRQATDEVTKMLDEMHLLL